MCLINKEKSSNIRFSSENVQIQKFYVNKMYVMADNQYDENVYCLDQGYCR